MVPLDDEHDDRLAELLVRFEAELADGASGDLFDSSVIDDDDSLVLEWEADRQCLELLDRVRRHWSPDAATGDTFRTAESATPTNRR